MKKTATTVVVLVLAVLMLAPIMGSVNLLAGKPAATDQTQLADGWPMPPLPPNSSAAGTALIADGWPMPPLPPNASSEGTVLVADGWPMPPLPPNASLAVAIG